jgi:hypothetical protein
MPKKKPPHIKAAAKKLNQEGSGPEQIVDQLEILFDVVGNPKTDPDAPGFSVSEKQVDRWIKGNAKAGELPWIDWKKMDDLPITALPADNLDVSGIKDAVLHFAIIAAEESVRRYWSQSVSATVKGRKQIIRNVLLDVQLRIRPRGRVLAYLAKTYLPDYIRRFGSDSEIRWGTINPSWQDQATVDEIIEEVDSGK